MLTLQAKPIAEIKRSVRALNPRVLFLNSSFNPSFIGMQEDSANNALVPVYNMLQALEILSKEYTCTECQARSILQELLTEYANQGRICPIFVTLLTPKSARQANPVFQAALDEYSFDPQTIAQIQDKN
jgi:hypothetical protein